MSNNNGKPMTYPEQKHSWGHSRYVFVSPVVAVAEAYGQKGGASSLHRHRHKGNSFSVRSGRLALHIDSDCGRSLVVLAAGQSMTVHAGVLHRMEFLEDSAIVEVYVSLNGQEIELDDITRLEPGWRPGESLQHRG